MPSVWGGSQEIWGGNAPPLDPALGGVKTLRTGDWSSRIIIMQRNGYRFLCLDIDASSTAELRRSDFKTLFHFLQFSSLHPVVFSQIILVSA